MLQTAHDVQKQIVFTWTTDCTTVERLDIEERETQFVT